MNDEIVDVEAVEIGTELELRQPAQVNLFRASEPGEVIVKAAETAKPLADVIRKQKLYKTIQGKNHVFVEGWTLLGSMLGVFPVVVWTRKLDNGWEARVEARTMAGVVVGAAEAQCLRTEARWAKADDYAIRSMAQTRATSRAMRGPLGFVIQLAGFQPEPAEDMPDGGTQPAKKGRGQTTAKGAEQVAERGSRASKDAGEPSARAAQAGAAEQPTSEDEGSASPASSGSSPDDSSPEPSAGEESPFKPPTGPRGGKATLLEAKELGEKLAALCEEIGATDSLPLVEQKTEAGEVAWLKRQIATAEKALARTKQEGS